MRTILSNAFSLQMLDGRSKAVVVPIDREEAVQKLFPCQNGGYLPSGKEYTGAWTLSAYSVIGHPDICRMINRELGIKDPLPQYQVNRESIKLDPYHDTLYVAQYVGGRLPEGATKLPEGAEIKWFRVDVEVIRKSPDPDQFYE